MSPSTSLRQRYRGTRGGTRCGWRMRCGEATVPTFQCSVTLSPLTSCLTTSPEAYSACLNVVTGHAEVYASLLRFVTLCRPTPASASSFVRFCRTFMTRRYRGIRGARTPHQAQARPVVMGCARHARRRDLLRAAPPAAPAAAQERAQDRHPLPCDDPAPPARPADADVASAEAHGCS